MPALQNAQKVQIIALSSMGRSLTQISEQLDIPRTTVARHVRRWREESSTARRRRPGSGRRPVSTQEEDEAVINVVRNQPFANAVQAKRRTQFPGCIRTVRKRIKSSDLRSRVAARKLHLTARHKEARVGFALQYLAGGDRFWEKVIFTDEKMFQSSRTSKIRVYRPMNHRFEQNYIAIRNTKRFSINLWGWICAQSRGIIVNIEDRLDANGYLRILENAMLPSVRAIFPENDFVFQQDNCPVHTARRVKEWFTNRDVTVLEWPSLSPDLNPIENLWGLIVKEIDQRNRIFQTRDQLMAAITDAWNAIPNNYFQNLCLSMPQRLAAVIESNGAPIKY